MTRKVEILISTEAHVLTSLFGLVRRDEEASKECIRLMMSGFLYREALPI